MTTTAVVFLAHAWSAAHRARFERLSREVAAVADCFLLYQRAGDGAAPQALGPESAIPADRIHAFSPGQLPRRLGYPFLTHRGIVPGCPHYALIDFALEHPYATYVSIEHDVDFTGNWSRLVGACSSAGADLVAAHLRTYHDAPSWHWWTSLRVPPTAGLSTSDLLKAFFPVYSISRRALLLVNRLQKDRWVGHFEALLPTVLRHFGLVVRDLLELGDFYAGTEQVPLRRDAVGQASTLRWRPEISLREFRARFRPDTLFHPVKGSWVYDGRHVVSAAGPQARPPPDPLSPA